MLKAYKYRLSPTLKQQDLLNQHFGCVRLVYNMALAYKKDKYKLENETVSCYDVKKLLVEWKKENDYLKLVNSLSLQQSVLNLDIAYKRFFKRQGGYPKFKSRKSNHFSFTVPQNTVVDFDNQKVKLPKFLEGINAKLHRKFEGTTKSSTISKTPSGKYYISILVDTIESKPLYQLPVNNNSTIGIDLGLKDFLILSTGEKVANPRYLKTSLKRLKQLSKRHSKSKLESNNRNKRRLKLNRLHEKVANQRKDFLHQVSAKLAYNPNINCIATETLKVKNMIKNRKLSRAIADVGWSSFLTYLEYKLENQGKTLVKIDSFYPSSKLCSTCGWKNVDLQLQDREWICKACNILHDRDLNASYNIKKQGLLTLKLNTNTAGTAGIQASGDNVRLAYSQQMSMKEEAFTIPLG